MDNFRPIKQPNHQKAYRQSQSNKGLVRYELQISAASKARFEESVTAAADEFDKPWDIRQRKAKARALLFDELTQGINHDFYVLKEEAKALRKEIKALSPSFFKDQLNPNQPIPEAIQALPDDPAQLKRLLSSLYSKAQQSKQNASKNEHLAKQYEELYNVSSQYCEELKQQLQDNQITVE